MKHLSLFTAVLMTLSACTGRTTLDGERMPVFAVPPSPDTAARPIEIEPVGEPFELRRLYSISTGQNPDHRVFQWPALAAHGRVFTMDGRQRVSAFDAETGRRLWRASWVRNQDNISFGDIAHGDGAVFAVSSSGHLARFNAETGDKERETRLSLRLKSGAVFCGGRVFFAGNENELYGVDANTLEIAIMHRTLSEPFQFMNGARPLCANDTLFAPFSNGELHAINPRTGQVLWMASIAGTHARGTFTDLVAPPMLVGNTLVAKSFYGPMRAVDITTGRELWHRPSRGRAAPAAAGGTLFDVSGSELCAIDAATGNTFYCVGLRSRRTYFSPIIAGAELLLARDDGVIEVRRLEDGSLIRTRNISRAFTADPFTYTNLLFLERRATLFALR